MQLVVWNSQGSKWDTFWTSYINPLVTAAPPQDVVGLLVESGWAPWVTPGEVTINSMYPVTDTTTWYSPTGSAASPFCQGVEQKRMRYGMWVPWVGNLDAFKTNTRCSMGGVMVPVSRNIESYDRLVFKGHKRPVVRVVMSRNRSTSFTVLLVHLLSGYWPKAQDELNDLVTTMTTLVPQSTPAIIVGDMNIDLLTVALAVPAKWRIVRTGVATQQSGGELDWGLLYDPNGTLGGASAAVVQQFKTGTNGSDHSVLRYDIPLS